MTSARIAATQTAAGAIGAFTLGVTMLGSMHMAQADSLPAATYTVETVQFKSAGETLVGRLLKPSGVSRGAAIAVLGPVAFVKEQSPIQYATRLVRNGFRVLVFDPRYHGESSGEPRRFESGTAKAEDLGAAVSYLAARPDVHNKQIFLLGICQGVNWVMEAAVRDSRVRAIGLVAGHYLTPATATMYLGGREVVRRRIADAKSARERFQATGQVDYIPIIDAENALLKAKLIGEWYAPWENSAPWFKFRGGWQNRITQMSEADIWGWDISKTARKITTPTLMVHADHGASGPKIPRTVFAKMKTSDKQLVWLKNANQLQFYEDPLTIDRAADEIAKSFHKKLQSEPTQ